MNSLRQEFTGLGLLAAGSLCIGLLVNELRQTPMALVYRSPQDRLSRIVEQISSPPATPGQRRNIELDEFQKLVAARRGIVIDARPPSFYQAGHIPGAINLPRENFDEAYPNVHAAIEPAKEREIVIYCSEADCRDSELVADALSRLGYRHLLVYKAGWAEWTRAGLPQTEGQTP